MDGDGTNEWVSWTQPGSGDRWLALDRNRNGSIDNGMELFGDFTDQPVTDTPNGYSALAIFDGADQGGDGNGVLDSRDAIYPRLTLWIDANHDGESQPNELQSLLATGVHWLELAPIDSQRRDRHGNELRFQALARLETAMTLSADVFLHLEEQTGP